MNELPEHVSVIEVGDKTIYLLATAHVSAQSAEDARALIGFVRPDSVCVELDEERMQNIMNENKWSDTDIAAVIKQKKSSFLLVNLLLSTYQKRLAEKFGIRAGQEMLEGIRAAEDTGAALIPADRSIKTTFLRIWRKIGFWNKIKLLFSLLMSLFDTEELTEEDLENLKKQDMLEGALSQLGDVLPDVKTYLVDERDVYLSEKIKNAPGNTVVAIVGAAHTPGIKKKIHEQHDIQALDEIPPASPLAKIAGWSIPVLIAAMVITTFLSDRSQGIEQLLTWILYNGALAALGTLLAGGHILSILTAFVAAPITSLNPLLAAGWFAGLTEAHFRKPTVRDVSALSEDLVSFKGLWKNKVTKILLVVIFANLGSTLGTILGGIEIFSVFRNLFL